MVTAILASIFLGGCGGNPRADELLARADSLMDVRPDSALTLLNEGIAVMDDSPESLRMRYRLLQAKAQNKAFQPFTSDSLMLAVADYYDRNGTANERMEAHYLLGCVYRDLGEAPRALTAFHEAVECVDTVNVETNNGSLSRIHAQIAVLLIDLQLPYEAMAEAKTAERLAWQVNDTLMAVDCKMLQANAYSLIGNSDKVAAISEYVSRIQLQCGDTVYALITLKPAINAYLELGELEKARASMSQFERLESIRGRNVVSQTVKGYDILKARYYLLNHFSDSAMACYRKAGSSVSQPKDLLHVYRGLARYYVENRVADSALKYTEKYVEIDDSIYRTSVRENFAKMHSLYNYERNKRLAELRGWQIRNLRTRQFLFLLLTLITGGIVFIYIKRKQMKMDAANRELNSRYVDTLLEYNRTKQETTLLRQWHEDTLQLVGQLRQEHEKYTETIKELSNKVGEYENRIKQNETDLKKQAIAIAAFQKDEKEPELWNLQEDLFNLPLLSRLHTCIAKGKQPSDGQLKELETAIEGLLPSFVPKLKELYPGINHANVLFCIFTKLRFINSERAVIFNISSQSVTNRCAFLYQKFTGAKGGAGDFEQFIQQIG